MVGIMLPYGLEAEYEISKYSYPILCCEGGERCVNGYQFLPHDGVGLICSCCICIDGDAGGHMNHRRFQLGLAFNVGLAHTDPIFRDNVWRPRVWDGRRALRWVRCRVCLLWEKGHVYQDE